jgi:FkbM family methyltransferase
MYDPIFAGRSDMVVVDLGANIGLFSLYAQDSASKLIAVEPAPGTFNILKKLTAPHSNIVTVNAAVGNSDLSVPFYLNENNTTNSLVSKQGQRIDVPGITLAQLAATHNLTTIDFVKCDIEGSEVIALTEATLDPVKDIARFWFVEVHQTDVNNGPWPGNLEQNRQNLASIFRNAGYETEFVINDQLYAWK